MYQTNTATGFSPFSGSTYIPQYATGYTPQYEVGYAAPTPTTTSPRDPALISFAAQINSATDEVQTLAKQAGASADYIFGTAPDQPTTAAPFPMPTPGQAGQVEYELVRLQAALRGLRDQMNRLSGL